jgi:hypothetical protein
MGELILEAGFPPGVINILPGYGPFSVATPFGGGIFNSTTSKEKRSPATTFI